MADRNSDGGVEARTEGQRLLLYKGVLVRVLNLHRNQQSLARTGKYGKFISHTEFYAYRVLPNIPDVHV